MILKNLLSSNVDVTDLGLTVPANGTYDLLGTDTSDIQNSTGLINLISDGSLRVIKFSTPEVLYSVSQSIRAVTGSQPDTTKMASGGEITIVSENNGHLVNNEVMNWTIEKFLDTDEEYFEIFVLPMGKILTLNFLEGGSYTVPTFIKLEWFKYFSDPGLHVRHNPEIRITELYVASANGNHNMNDTIINVNDDHGLLVDMEIGLYYCFQSATGSPAMPMEFIRKVTAVDSVAKTITLETGLPMGGLADGMKIGLTDRVIGQKGNQISSSLINWVSPPRFQGNGTDYLKATISNEDVQNSGLVTSIINGWYETGNMG